MKVKIVHVIFDDHSSGPSSNARLIRCDVFGALIGETKRAYFVSPWISDLTLIDDNSDCYSIRKTAVIEIRVLKEVCLKPIE